MDTKSVLCGTSDAGIFKKNSLSRKMEKALWWDSDKERVRRYNDYRPEGKRKHKRKALYTTGCPRKLGPYSDSEMAVETPVETVFDPSDGIVLLDNGKRFIHETSSECRQVVLSRNWVHINWNRTQSWVVRAKRASSCCDDVYFGITEASVFYEETGWAMGFDVRGNFMRGTSPLKHEMMHSMYTHNVEVEESSWVRVTADLQAQKMVWEIFDGEKPPEPEDNPLVTLEEKFGTDRKWQTARLWVSTDTHNNCIELV